MVEVAFQGLNKEFGHGEPVRGRQPTHKEK